MATTPGNEGTTKQRKARKRADGEGSISHHASGQWRGRLMVGYQPDGTPDRREVYGKTQQEARQKLDALKTAVAKGSLIAPTRTTVAEMLDQWIQDGTTRGLRPATLAKYQQLTRLYLVPNVGRVKLRDLRPEHVRALCADLIGRGLAPSTVRDVRSMLHGALRLAESLDIVGRNVVDAVRPPKAVRHEITPPTPTDVARLLDISEETDDRWQALWMLAAYSGCRPGELLALTWSDVAWDAGGVTIRRNLSSVRGAVPVLLPPKTVKGRRVVSVAPEAIEALRKHRLRQDAMRVRLGDDYHDDDLIFATHTGMPLDHHNVVRAFKELVRRAGLPATTRLYDLRHAHATALFAAGVHPKAASERLGHAAISLTLDTYTHAIAGLDAEAGIKVGRLFQAQRSGRTRDEEQS